MKKIGVLFGSENTFPHAVIDRINGKNIPGILAESVQIDMVSNGHPLGYAVIVDRIAQEIPFYSAFLKNAALGGTAVLNNPFWTGMDEHYFNNSLAEKIGISVPKTVLLPSKERPDGTNENSFRNLAFPMAWEEMFRQIGFPAMLKPHRNRMGTKTFRVLNPQDLWNKHEQTGQEAMLLQQEINFEAYYRCICVDRKEVLIMPYEPRHPHHLRYAIEMPAATPEHQQVLDRMKNDTLRLNEALGYDMNAVEFAVKDHVPYAINFCNPSPDVDMYSVGPDYFEWIVEATANMAIARAQKVEPNQTNLTWGTFLRESILGSAIDHPEKPTPKARRESTSPKKAGTKAPMSAKKSTTSKKPGGAASNQDLPAD
ncbi:hypothetical protein CLV98_103244 [Dyadobacter jejuensis]|uniref:ATP-grasp domain-containing protein n=1 Tax=Dyadobacter jejuensis TaxID=1082580 RepID=A0A316B8H1_9BACT|nr:hypothetical protein [Dyadobacter jejuensis]PWJ58877.1 hypothetical protein CLV98_103244 [Dyadobacter jejuensis]